MAATTKNGTETFHIAEGDLDPLDNPAWVAAHEDELLAALDESEEQLSAHYEVYTVDRVQVPVGPGKTAPLSLPLRAISYKVFKQCEKRATHRSMGVLAVDEREQQAWVVYEASHPTIRARLWDAPRFRDKYGQRPIDPVMGVLKLPGELAGAAVLVGNMSKLYDRPNDSEVAKSAD